MKPVLPALTSIRAFESAARHLSFTKAASELNVTPAAVSQLIRQLEVQVGNKLFNRTTRSLALTERGRAALPHLLNAFEHLHSGVRELRGEVAADMISVSVNPSFGSSWLLPRLANFHATHPQLSVRIDTRDDLVDFLRDGIDIAIRQGRGEYNGLISECLIRDSALVVCSPDLLPDREPLKSPGLLVGRTLLHTDWQTSAESAPDWARWAAYHGIVNLDLLGGLRFSLEDLAVRAAVSGMGFALTTQAYVERDLAEGRLARAFHADYDMPTAFHHFVVHPPLTKTNRKKITLFRDWLFQQVT